MKYILIIGDGMADNPVEALGGKTPLQAADKPELDDVAAKGVIGLAKNVPDGLPPGSDTAILSLFGCDPRQCYTGRAPLEAAASGIRLQPGDVAYRCNMVTYEDGDMPFEEKRILSHSAGSIEGEQSDAMITALFAEPRFKAAAEKAGICIHPASSFRHMAVQSQADIQGIRLCPPHDHLGEKIGPILPAGCENARVLRDLMALAHEILDHHPMNEARRAAGKMPANGIWFWAEGTAVALPAFTPKYHKKGAVISAVPLCVGIGALTGVDAISVPGATGELDTNYEGKAECAARALLAGGYDYVALHVEAPDECTHNGDTPGKIQAIENISQRVLKPLREAMRGADYRMLIISDHKTLTSTRGHDGDPVPYILYDSRRDSGLGKPYCEASAQGQPVVEGVELLGLLFAE